MVNSLVYIGTCSILVDSVPTTIAIKQACKAFCAWEFSFHVSWGILWLTAKSSVYGVLFNEPEHAMKYASKPRYLRNTISPKSLLPTIFTM